MPFPVLRIINIRKLRRQGVCFAHPFYDRNGFRKHSGSAPFDTFEEGRSGLSHAQQVVAAVCGRADREIMRLQLEESIIDDAAAQAGDVAADDDSPAGLLQCYFKGVAHAFAQALALLKELAEGRFFPLVVRADVAGVEKQPPGINSECLPAGVFQQGLVDAQRLLFAYAPGQAGFDFALFRVADEDDERFIFDGITLFYTNPLL